MKQQFFSFLHWLLIKKSGYRYKGKIRRSIWARLWRYSLRSYKGTITFRLHGTKVRMNNGYPYPLFLNTFLTYNDPLVEIVYQVYKTLNRPVDYVDVGAAIGDTMLLVLERCPDMIRSWCCVDGDPQFFEYLKYNLKEYSNGQLINALLTDHGTNMERELVSNHPGTYSATGKEYREAVSLDRLLLDQHRVNNVDLIKTDLDGLDGKVLSGAIQMLQKFKPAIIFEWHPHYMEKTNHSPMLPFKTLQTCQYDQFLFFDKYGKFSHFNHNPSDTEIEFLSRFCIRENHQPDWHYDVIALPQDHGADILQLAEMTYTKGKIRIP